MSVSHSSRFDITILVPVLNEEETIPLFLRRVNEVMDLFPEYRCEYLFIDGGSTDKTAEILRQERQKDDRIKVITLSRSFGKEASLVCGLKYASGQAVIPMDADLQDPPEVIPAFIKKWNQGYDIVYGTRKSRQDEPFLKRLTSKLFYQLFNVISDQPIPADTGDFRLMSRRAVKAVLQMPERTQFMKEMFHWVGFKSCGVSYERPERIAGTTKFNYWKLWNFALDGITASTTFPLRIWTYIGVLFAGGAATYALGKCVLTLLYGIDQPGYASLLSFIIFFGAIQMIISGIQGEYIGRILKESKQRPVYIVADMDGVESSDSKSPELRLVTPMPEQKKSA
ncbi:MAG: glycosyltransferase family 2 protein [Planctomycetaceae bacterium]|jgi:glycosyltransferase involved in cell wall biosynthesis|nr:glycosyltransferase family 2 protein [Planctomycetaceae bacterium]